MITKNEKNIDINFLKENHRSDFHNGLLKEELNSIIAQDIIIDEHINIKNSFIYDNADYIEIGIYIVNASKKEIEVKNLPLLIYFNENDYKQYTLELNKTIEANGAVFKEIKLHKAEIQSNIDYKNISIAVDRINSIKKFPYINIEIVNIPQIKEYTNYRDVKKFIKNLYPVDHDVLAIDTFAVGGIDEGFYMILLFRNSSSKDINIKSLPITVLTDNDLIIYSGDFTPQDDSLLIPSNKGKMMTIVIPAKDFPIIEGQDLSQYKVSFN